MNHRRLIPAATAAGLVLVGALVGAPSASAARMDLQRIAGGTGTGTPTQVNQSIGTLAVDRRGSVYTWDQVYGLVRVLKSQGRQSVVIGGGSMRLGNLPVTGALPRGISLVSSDVNSLAVDDEGSVVFGVPSNLAGEGGIYVLSAVSGTRYGLNVTAGRVYRLLGGGQATTYGSPGPQTKVGALSGVTLTSRGTVVALASVGDGRCSITAIARDTGTDLGRSLDAGVTYALPSPQTWCAGKLAVDGAGLVALGGETQELWLTATSPVTAFGHTFAAGESISAASVAPSYQVSEVSFDLKSNLLVSGGGSTTADREQYLLVRSATSGSPSESAGQLVRRSFALHQYTKARPLPQGGVAVAYSDSYAPASEIVVNPGATARTGYGQSLPAGTATIVAGDGPALGHDRFPFAVSTGQMRPLDVEGEVDGSFAFRNLQLNGTSQSSTVAYVPAHDGTYFGQAMRAGFAHELPVPVGVECGELALSQVGLACMSGQHSVYLIPRQSGTFFGQAMTAGVAKRIATSDFAAGGFQELRFDSHGSLFVADTINTLAAREGIYAIAAQDTTILGLPLLAGLKRLVAGSLVGAGPAFGQPATASGLHGIGGFAVDDSDNILIFDAKQVGTTLRWTGTLEVVAASNGTFYGQVATAGKVYAVTDPWTIPANITGGELGVVVDSAGQVFIPEVKDLRPARLVGTSGVHRYGLDLVPGGVYALAMPAGPLARVGSDVVVTATDGILRLVP